MMSPDDAMEPWQRVVQRVVDQTKFLIGEMDVQDAVFGISTHGGVLGPAHFQVQRWAKEGHGRRKALRADSAQNSRGCVCLAERQAIIALAIADLLRLSRLSVGRHEFGFDFGQGAVTVRDGIIRDVFLGRRVFLTELADSDKGHEWQCDDQL